MNFLREQFTKEGLNTYFASQSVEALFLTSKESFSVASRACSSALKQRNCEKIKGSKRKSDDNVTNSHQLNESV